jgi:hypothetical protein
MKFLAEEEMHANRLDHQIVDRSHQHSYWTRRTGRLEA